MSKRLHRVTEYLWLGFAAAALIFGWGAIYIVGALILSAIHQLAADLIATRIR